MSAIDCQTKHEKPEAAVPPEERFSSLRTFRRGVCCLRSNILEQVDVPRRIAACGVERAGRHVGYEDLDADCVTALPDKVILRSSHKPPAKTLAAVFGVYIQLCYAAGE